MKTFTVYLAGYIPLCEENLPGLHTFDEANALAKEHGGRLMTLPEMKALAKCRSR